MFRLPFTEAPKSEDIHRPVVLDHLNRLIELIDLFIAIHDENLKLSVPVDQRCCDYAEICLKLRKAASSIIANDLDPKKIIDHDFLKEKAANIAKISRELQAHVTIVIQNRYNYFANQVNELARLILAKQPKDLKFEKLADELMEMKTDHLIVIMDEESGFTDQKFLYSLEEVKALNSLSEYLNSLNDMENHSQDNSSTSHEQCRSESSLETMMSSTESGVIEPLHEEDSRQNSNLVVSGSQSITYEDINVTHKKKRLSKNSKRGASPKAGSSRSMPIVSQEGIKQSIGSVDSSTADSPASTSRQLAGEESNSATELAKELLSSILDVVEAEQQSAASVAGQIVEEIIQALPLNKAVYQQPTDPLPISSAAGSSNEDVLVQSTDHDHAARKKSIIVSLEKARTLLEFSKHIREENLELEINNPNQDYVLHFTDQWARRHRSLAEIQEILGLDDVPSEARTKPVESGVSLINEINQTYNSVLANDIKSRYEYFLKLRQDVLVSKIEQAQEFANIDDIYRLAEDAKLELEEIDSLVTAKLDQHDDAEFLATLAEQINKLKDPRVYIKSLHQRLEQEQAVVDALFKSLIDCYAKVRCILRTERFYKDEQAEADAPDPHAEAKEFLVKIEQCIRNVIAQPEAKTREKILNCIKEIVNINISLDIQNSLSDVELEEIFSFHPFPMLHVQLSKCLGQLPKGNSRFFEEVKANPWFWVVLTQSRYFFMQPGFSIDDKNECIKKIRQSVDGIQRAELPKIFQPIYDEIQQLPKVSVNQDDEEFGVGAGSSMAAGPSR